MSYNLSTPSVAAVTENVIDQIMRNADLIAAVSDVMDHTRMAVIVAPPDDALGDKMPTFDHLAQILKMAVNGTMGLPDQKVTMEYLRSSQKLIIPYALGMNPVAGEPSRTARQEVLVARYWKMTTMTYAEVRGLLRPIVNAVRIRTVVDALPLVPGPVLFQGWNQPEYYVAPDIETDHLQYADAIFSTVSAALQFNCDLRDTGFLNTPESSVGDGDWQMAATVPFERIRTKLRSRSITLTAALNLAGVANEPLAAFTRGFGLSIGLLPNLDSLTTREFRFEAKMPEPDDRKVVNNFHKTYERPLMTPCMQLLALFGLMHLAKDRTYRTGDAAMMRIGMSYLMTLKTYMTAIMMDKMKQNMETYVSTAAHPFGLGQTYWLAKVLGVHGKLVSPLAVRLDVSPPPVRRLMIADAARKEWLGMPAGRLIDTLYNHFYDAMETEKAKVIACPPAYSSLHRLYGIPTQLYVDASVMVSIQSMMPAIYGYAMITHKGEKDEADGLALALSLKNVQREQKGLVQMGESAWAKYGHKVEDAGLAEFIQHMQQMPAAPTSG